MVHWVLTKYPLQQFVGQPLVFGFFDLVKNQRGWRDVAGSEDGVVSGFS